MMGTVRERARSEASAAMDRADIDIEVIHQAGEAQAACDLFNRVWHMPPGADVLELSTVVALAHSGNYVVLAREPRRSHAGDDDPAPRRVIGASLGFFGPPGQPMHSHITGVAHGATGRGVGRALKLHQRSWALDCGVTQITWTYDPLVARNAFFNIAKIGARAVAYYPDHYGPMVDGLNAGQGSDRVLLRWDLETDLPTKMTGRHTSGVVRHAALSNAGGAPSAVDVDDVERPDIITIEVPDDIEAVRRVDPDLAIRWRLATRIAFTSRFDSGWQVTGIEAPARYILTREH
ncbi:MAG: hypothetical protein WA962_09265 [Ornithinimicrobium sp.]